MPTVSTFFGMIVRMFFNEHPPPHFHVAYQRRRALIGIETGTILYGYLPPGALRVVREWAERHRDDLMDNWERARVRQPLQRIRGADAE